MIRMGWPLVIGWLLNIVGIVGPEMVSAADVVVGRVVPAAQRRPLAAIDHADWDALLRTYVDERGMVNYRAWQQSPSDVETLDRYLLQLSATNGEGSREEMLAFWINAYNALTVKGILREYPTSSIRNHTAKVFGYNIWKNLKLVVGGKPVSLDEMEHQILRKMEEPRIHFAIVCASMGCPRLLNSAYHASTLDEQLAENTRAFFADNAKFRYDAKRQLFYLSPILDWFAEDFGDSDSAKLQGIAEWAPSAEATRVAAQGRGSIQYLDYDWGLNDQKSSR